MNVVAAGLIVPDRVVAIQGTLWRIGFPSPIRRYLATARCLSAPSDRKCRVGQNVSAMSRSAMLFFRDCAIAPVSGLVCEQPRRRVSCHANNEIYWS
jgi:hypothetical protein